MLCSRSRHVLFVHVQKTGGVTIEKLLLDQLPGAETLAGNKWDGRHTTLRGAISLHPEFSDYWTFGFVRNPWARMYSWHSMIIRRGDALERGSTRVASQLRSNPFWRGTLKRYRSFERFVLEGPDEFVRLRRPQGEYLRADGKRADFIGRTESLETDLARLMEHLDLPAPEVVARENAAPENTGGYREHYTPEMRDRVGELFARDVEEFDYDF